jgi:alpha-L-fucosidase
MYDQAQTYAIVKTLQPQIVINNRLDLGINDSDRKILSPNADYYTPEQTVGAYDDQRPWESCMTVSRKGQWAWGGASDGVKPFRECLEMLIQCAGGDGNLLFNIGPMPNGQIAPEQQERLRQIGAWLAKNGESIYGTRGGPFKPGKYGVSTRKGNTVYLHLKGSAPSPVKLPPLPARIVSSRVLDGRKVEVHRNDQGLEIALPEPAPESELSPIDTIVALQLDVPALSLGAQDVQ